MRCGTEMGQSGIPRRVGYAVVARTLAEVRDGPPGRYFLPDQPLHVIQRGNNREAVFFCDDDYERYRAWLAEAAARHGCTIHAYVLITNHVHLLPTPQGPHAFPPLIQPLGPPYVRHVNA